MGPMIAFAVLTLLLWFVLFVVVYRIPVCRGTAAGRDYPRLSVIVPARNEERNIPRLLDSLRVQEPPPFEIIVVDDGSTDATGEIARKGGATVLESKPLPAGWRGKTWACMQGAERAGGDVLLFVDADTFFEPGGLRRILDTYFENPGVLSVGAYHRVRCLYEDFSAYFNIIMTAGTGAFTVFGRQDSPSGLFGPFLMVDRKAYESIGGHRPVRDKILENFHLARVFRATGVPLRCCGGKGSFSMRMYPDGLRDLISGWSKAFASGAAETPRWILFTTVAWITGAILAVIYPGAAVFAGDATALSLAVLVYLLYAVQLATLLRRIGTFRYATAFLFPVPLLFFLAVFGRATVQMRLKRKVSWKGREIDGDSTAPRKG
jgi:4,4'-diaponeurosporenoate glycosyltransferase